MILGIDLHNIRDGGGITYVANLLRQFDPRRHAFRKIVLFGAADVLDQLPDSPAVEKKAYPGLRKGFLHRIAFLLFRLTGETRKAGCDVLYAPGGLYLGGFKPFVTISRNMLPFQRESWSLYPWGADRGRLYILRWLNAAAFRRASGVIFLTHHAARVIGQQAGRLKGKSVVIPHGVDRTRFRRSAGKPLTERMGADQRIVLVCPARLEPYRHQIELVRAVASLRSQFPKIELVMCGPANRAYQNLLEREMQRLDPAGSYLHWRGLLPNAELPALYDDAQMLVFASSCENLPNTLIEALCFGIPTVSSDVMPMPEIYGDACRSFNPADSESISVAIRDCLGDWEKTRRMVASGQRNVQDYSWERCADRTFSFLASFACARQSSPGPERVRLSGGATI